MESLIHKHIEIIQKEYNNSFDGGGHNLLDCKEISSKSAEITKDIAIEFAVFLGETYETYDGLKYWYYTDDERNIIFTIEELFEEFLKTKQ